LAVPSKMELADLETFKLIYDAIPFLQDLDKILEEETGYPLEEIYVGSALLDIEQEYKSPKGLRNKLAANNLYSFVDQFCREDRGKVEAIMYDLQDLGFDVDPVKPDLTCEKMKKYTACDQYIRSLPTHVYVDSTPFRYDDENDLKHLLQAIDLIKQVKLPIEKLQLDPVAVPKKEKDDRHENKIEELTEIPVEVVILDEIDVVEDFEFNY